MSLFFLICDIKYPFALNSLNTFKKIKAVVNYFMLKFVFYLINNVVLLNTKKYFNSNYKIKRIHKKLFNIVVNIFLVGCIIILQVQN